LRGRHLQLMPRTGIPDWRDERVYEQLHGIDRHGLMWEWLRRDAAYVAWQVRASNPPGGTGAAGPMGPLQWGLQFCLKTRRSEGRRGGKEGVRKCGSRWGG